MQNRRQFIGATALASIPAALALGEGFSYAQGSAAAQTSADDTAARVLSQIARENARAYNDGKRSGIRGEHFRVAAANLRLFAALNLDDQLRRATRQQVRAHGGDAEAVARHLDRSRLQRELRQAGAAISAAELDRMLLQFQPTQKTIAEATSPGFSASAHLLALAELLDKDSLTASRVETGPYRRVAALVDCQKYAYEINMVAYLVAILCLSGNVPGCAAGATSLALLQSAMYAAGC